ncbi:penicillin-binding transpeptidase domain-containing protein [Gallaecimonas kandeliae]|uniref:peptidoglycan D,D-transpeptidase FtsI family protein n=1 Tax=Gallaecimonas kandeliae TaxID=3029055 RepID=UPI00264A0C6A|nr:penicillin-binding transpeptidase domain-containing protein [Gallaecimonas kandeliae]WKE66079.1 penicillin-binding transpeptidase domain-containing protein [Gallaecimonas kandeliae]
MSKRHARNRVKPGVINWRHLFAIAVMGAVFTALVARAAYIQVISPDRLRQEGDNRSLRVTSTQVPRGLITDRNGEELAVSVPVDAIYADPKVVLDKGGLQDKRRWQALAEVLGTDAHDLMDKISSDPSRRFVYLQRQVTPAMAHYVKELKIPGIGLKRESKRYYPTGEVDAHIIGFTNIDDHGLEGIERTYDDLLTGTPGKRKVRKDGLGRVVESLGTLQAAEKPQELQLTIDQRIQALAYRELKKAVSYYEATSGSVVVVDVPTGEVLAMANVPSYNPNNRTDVKAYQLRNRAITDVFEPGSTAKPLAMMAALDNGAVKLDQKIDTNPGWMRLGGRRVQDHRNLGVIDLTTIIEKSSNMGIAKLALALPKEELLGTYTKFGFGSETGIDLVGESAGLFQYDRPRWSEFELATLAFGYSISVTPAQLARAYATLGNEGRRLPLSIIKGLPHPPAEQVVKPKVAREVLHMMESVVRPGGTAPKAAVPGYRVAGKTGTARKAVAGGYGNEYVASFAGLAPASHPKLAIVVMINEPSGDLYYGGDVAAPVFSSVMGGALSLLNVTPDAITPDMRVAASDKEMHRG